MASPDNAVDAASSGVSYLSAVFDHSLILAGTGACRWIQLVIWDYISIDSKEDNFTYDLRS